EVLRSGIHRLAVHGGFPLVVRIEREALASRLPDRPVALALEGLAAERLSLEVVEPDLPVRVSPDQQHLVSVGRDSRRVPVPWLDADELLPSLPVDPDRRV